MFRRRLDARIVPRPIIGFRSQPGARHPELPVLAADRQDEIGLRQVVERRDDIVGSERIRDDASLTNDEGPERRLLQTGNETRKTVVVPHDDHHPDGLHVEALEPFDQSLVQRRPLGDGPHLLDHTRTNEVVLKGATEVLVSEDDQIGKRLHRLSPSGPDTPDGRPAHATCSARSAIAASSRAFRSSMLVEAAARKS
ncbi:hypothetical protein [Euzebya pacifica]|uniref:hypothetical protein n=1 Tax=Euzebya pacifica TaxID=1608957 RepID=UPI000DF7C718|nr:hypothetical protein [Euzebya pacifica]